MKINDIILNDLKEILEKQLNWLKEDLNKAKTTFDQIYLIGEIKENLDIKTVLERMTNENRNTKN